MLKKLVSIVLVLIQFLSIPLQACDSFVEDVVNRANPHGKIWERHLQKGGVQSFKEYYISSQDRACGFRAFGYDSRKSALAAVKNILNNPADPKHKTVKKFLSNSIRSESPLFETIFSSSLPSGGISEAFANSLQNQQKYLNYYENPGIELDFSQTHDQNGLNLYSNLSYTLINALAVINDVNLYIYRPIDQNSNRLYLAHAFRQDHLKEAKTLSLIYKSAHYNLLIPQNVNVYQEFLTEGQALDQQNRHLDELRQRTLADSLLNQNNLYNSDISTEDSDDDSRMLLINDNLSNQQENPQRSHYDNWNTITDDIESEDELIDLEEESTPLPASTVTPSFTDDQFFQFVKNFYSQRLGNLTKEQSCQVAYDHFKDQRSSTSTFALTRLALDKNFVPQGKNKDAFFNELFAKLERVNSSKREEHYSKIFQGKILIKLGKFEDAYKVLNGLKEKDDKLKRPPFTRTYLVDIGELIIDHDYVPARMTPDSALQYATGILEKLDLSRNKSRSSRVQVADSNDLLGGEELNRVGTQNRIQDAQDRAVTRQHQTPPSENRSSRRPANQNSRKPRQERAMPNLGEKVTPIFIPRKPVQELIHTMLNAETQTPANRNQVVPTEPSNARSWQIVYSDSEEVSNSSHNVVEDFFEGGIDERESETCRHLLLLGKSAGKKRDTKKVVEYCTQVLEITENMLEGRYFQAQALIGLGNARDGDNVQHYKDALKLAKEIGDKRLEAQALIGLGNARDGDNVQHYKDALKLATEIEDKGLQAQALIGLGNARDGDNVQHYKDALKLAEDIRDKGLQAQALIGLGNAKDGDRIKHYNEALERATEIEDKGLQAQALIGLGNARDGDNVQHYKDVLNLATEIGDKGLQAQAFIGLGNARDGDNVQHYKDALKLAKEIGDKRLEAQALIGLGNVRDGYNVQHYKDALKLAEEIGDKGLQAQALIGLGNVRDGDRVKHYKDALNLAKEIGDKGLQAQALIGLGNARDGDRVKHYKDALKLATEIGEKGLQAQALIGLGNARDGLDKVIQDYKDALKLAEDIRDKGLQAQALIGLGNAKDGDRIKHYNEALERATEIGDKGLQAQALIGLGNARDGYRVKHYKDALKLATEIGNKCLQAQAFIGLGNARDGDNVQHYKKALKLATEIGDKGLQAQALIGLGNAKDGDRIKHYNEALERATEIGDKGLQAQALIGLGNATRGQNQALYYKDALELAKEIGDKSLQAQALIGFGNATRDEVSLNYFQQALAVAPNDELKQKAQNGINRVFGFLNRRNPSNNNRDSGRYAPYPYPNNNNQSHRDNNNRDRHYSGRRG